MSDSAPGIVVVVPVAGSGTDQHFAHTYALAGELAKLARTAVIVERVQGGPAAPLPGVATFTQSATDAGPVRRALELAKLAVRLRRQGYGTFFVRTSQTAAVPVALVTRVLGGRTLYWNCVQKPRERLRDVGVRTALRSELPLRAAFRLADLVVTGTRGLAEHYSAQHGIAADRMAVLPNEIDLRRYGPPTPEQRTQARAGLGIGEDVRLVLSVHRLSPVRQTLRYIPAVPLAVLREVPGARFVFVGGGPEEPALRTAVEAAGLADRVTVRGAVPHAEIAGYYHAADAFLMPSYTEGFPRVLLEAMAMGLPFASTDVGGVREVVPDAYRPLLAPRDAPDVLARRLSGILLDGELAARLAAAGSEWVRQYDAPAVARRLVALARRDGVTTSAVAGDSTPAA